MVQEYKQINGSGFMLETNHESIYNRGGGVNNLSGTAESSDRTKNIIEEWEEEIEDGVEQEAVNLSETIEENYDGRKTY